MTTGIPPAEQVQNGENIFTFASDARYDGIDRFGNPGAIVDMKGLGFMYSSRRGSSLPGRARLAAAAALALGLTLSAGPVLAHGDHDNATGAREQSGAKDLCTDAREDRLEAAGDNFAKACLPGQDLAQTKSFESDLAEGEVDSSPNTKLVANLPKQGRFDSTSALNSDLAFQGGYAYAGNYEGFMVYDI